MAPDDAATTRQDGYNVLPETPMASDSQPIHPKHAVIVVVDRLGAGFLGPYGNTWVETPSLNQLAAESLLVETVISDSPDLDRIYRSWWYGCHAMQQRPRQAESLVALARSSGLPTTLLSDAAALLDDPRAAAFDERISLARPAPDRPAAKIEQTRLAELFMTAAARLAELESPGLFWIHARGMGGCWDAPLDLREQYRDEEDPEPYSRAAPPEKDLGRRSDPDELLRIEHAYAAEVFVFDAALGMLLEVLDQHPCSEETLLVVTSPRGYPLGEHGVVGSLGDALHAELLQVPLLIRPPEASFAATRLQMLAQHHDLHATLANWLGIPCGQPRDWRTDLRAIAGGEPIPQTNCAFAVGTGERAVRTPAWFMRETQGDQRALYAKPDDRWEINEVANRCVDIADELADLITRFDETVNADEPGPLPELAAELIDGTA
jgi:hypothetical protein